MLHKTIINPMKKLIDHQSGNENFLVKKKREIVQIHET